MAWTRTNAGHLRRRYLPFIAAVLAACGGGGGSENGMPVDAHQPPSQAASCSSITQLQVAVTGVRFARGSQQPAQGFSPARTIDLLAPQAGVLQTLGLAPLDAGTTAQVRLATGQGTVTFADGSTAVLRVPGGTTISAGTQVPSDQLADLVVPSFDACSSVHAAGNSGQWLLTGNNVAAQLRALPISTGTSQVAGSFRPLPGGGWAVVNTDGSGTFTVQRFDSFGNAQGDMVTITLPLGSGDTQPTLTPLASGYLTTWLGPTLNPQMPLSAPFPLFAQLLDASGTPLAAPMQVAVTTPFTSRIVPASLPHAAALSDGGAALVWVQAQGSSLDVFLQRFSATGMVGSAQQVNDTTSNGMPTVVGQDNGNVLVVWGLGDLFARVVAPDGTPGPQQAIAPGAVSLAGPASVSPAPGGGAAVAWLSQTGSGVVFVERLGPDGAPVSGPQPVDPSTTAGQSDPSVGVLADGSAVVAWIESGESEVHARRFAADGTPLGDAQVVGSSHAAHPVVVPLSWGGFVIEYDSPAGPLATLRDAQGLKG